MRDARRVGAFFSGLFLYCTAIGCATMLADLHLPKAIAQRLGGKASLMVIGVEALAIALLIFAVALVWAYFSVKPGSKGRRMATGWFFSGVGTGWLCGLIYGAFYFALNPRTFQSTTRLLLASDAPPLWGLLNILAIVIATLIASALARKFRPKTVHARRSAPAQTAIRSTTAPAA